MSSTVGHLAARFWWSVRHRRRPLEPDEEGWLVDLVGTHPARFVLAMDTLDRRHAHDGARVVWTTGGLDPALRHDAAVAAALHDVGKLASGLGTTGRVVATVVGRLVPARWVRTPAAATRWEPGDAPIGGWAQRVAAYRDHDTIGAAMLVRCGVPELAVRWALEHHLAEGDRTIDPTLARVLEVADEPSVRPTTGSKVPL